MPTDALSYLGTCCIPALFCHPVSARHEMAVKDNLRSILVLYLLCRVTAFAATSAPHRQRSVLVSSRQHLTGVQHTYSSMDYHDIEALERFALASSAGQRAELLQAVDTATTPGQAFLAGEP